MEHLTRQTMPTDKQEEDTTKKKTQPFSCCPFNFLRLPEQLLLLMRFLWWLLHPENVLLATNEGSNQRAASIGGDNALTPNSVQPAPRLSEQWGGLANQKLNVLHARHSGPHWGIRETIESKHWGRWTCLFSSTHWFSVCLCLAVFD